MPPNMVPRPHQKPYPPIWVGGESKPALRRVAAFGNGWHCGLILPERIPSKVNQLKDLMNECNREFRDLEITALALSSRTDQANLDTYRDAGVHVLYMLPVSSDTNTVLGEMEQFARRMALHR